MKILDDELETRFTFHPAGEDQVPRYEAIRAKALELAKFIVEATPGSREQSLAVTHLEETVLWANAAIARNEPHNEIREGDPRMVGVTPEMIGGKGYAEQGPPIEDQGEKSEPANPPDAGDERGTGSVAGDTDPKCPSCGGRGCPACRYSGKA